MHVAVGSTNPVKLAAVEEALAPLDPTVSAESVESGVAEQPRSVVETIAGAENRAERALAAVDGGADVYGVGIEGGVTDCDADGLFLVMWAAATDGERLERGAGPALRLPGDVATQVRGGRELGPVLDDRLGTDGVARREGAAGVFTDGLTSRRSALVQAVACAVGPHVSRYYP